MNQFNSLTITGFDHVEFAVDALEPAVQLHKRMGFFQVGKREIRERGLTTIALSQGNARIFLSQSSDPNDPISQFVSRHGSGIYNVAFSCQNAHEAFERTLQRGAIPVGPPKSNQKDFGKTDSASIKAFGDVIHSFITRQGRLLGEGFDEPFESPASLLGITEIDHLTSNVEKGELNHWANWYEQVFGLENTRFFDIKTERTGLYSKVMESPGHLVKLPLNEPTDSKSQIQEFLNVNHGPGIQHLALLTPRILDTVPQLNKSGIPFLEGPPDTYYEAVPTRVPHLKEDLKTLQDHSILVDGDQTGYLLQIFSQNLIGPFFYEVIQREGNQGFGEGNFGALFEAIERDQIRRGVL